MVFKSGCVPYNRIRFFMEEIYNGKIIIHIRISN